MTRRPPRIPLAASWRGGGEPAAPSGMSSVQALLSRSYTHRSSRTWKKLLTPPKMYSLSSTIHADGRDRGEGPALLGCSSVHALASTSYAHRSPYAEKSEKNGPKNAPPNTSIRRDGGCATDAANTRGGGIAPAGVSTSQRCFTVSKRCRSS